MDEEDLLDFSVFFLYVSRAAITQIKCLAMLKKRSTRFQITDCNLKKGKM